jgi:hypothetical protein
LPYLLDSLFYLLRAEGVSDLVALAAGAALPALGALFTPLVRRRTSNTDWSQSG